MAQRHGEQPEGVRRERILAAAMACFARHGFAAASIRRIAREAEVSPSLVQHFHPSKAALRAAVNDYVIQTVQGELAGIRFDLPVADIQSAISSVLVNLALRHPEAHDYLRRAVFEGDEAATELQVGLFRLAESTMRRMAAAGALRPGTDIQWASVQVTLLASGPNLIRAAVEQYLGQSLNTRAGLLRLHHANEALVERGIMRNQPSGDHTAADQQADAPD